MFKLKDQGTMGQLVGV